jgi:transposase
VWDGSGLLLVWKQLEGGRFRWPPVVDGAVHLTPLEFAALLEGLDWARVGRAKVRRRPLVPA